MATANNNRDKNSGRNGTVYWTLGGKQKPKELEAQNINLDEIHASDDSPNDGSKKWRTVFLAILAVGVVATAVILGVFLSKRGGKDDSDNLTDVPSFAPSSDSNPTLSPTPGSSLSPSSAALYSCVMPGTEVAVASANFAAVAAKAMEGCKTFPCTVAMEDTDAYGLVRDACNATGGALHAFTLNFTCSSNSVVFNNYSVCSACTANSTKADLESVNDIESCTDVYSHTGTTDFSGSVPTDPPASSPSDSSPSCLVMSSAVQMARGDLDDQVGSDILDCVTFKLDCGFDVSRKHGYTELMDACEAAKGVFHIIKLNMVCPYLSLEFNNYPECLVSENQDSACTAAFLEDSFETAWDVDGCDEIATHTGTTNVSGS
jgi:hypothetical protein